MPKRRLISTMDRNAALRRRQNIRLQNNLQQQQQQQQQQQPATQEVPQSLHLSHQQPQFLQQHSQQQQHQQQHQQQQEAGEHAEWQDPSASPAIARQDHFAITALYVGPMTDTCPHCHALRFCNEKYNCCHNGKVALLPLNPYPQELKHLFLANDAISKNFLDNIRQYNSSVSFASFGAQMEPPSGRGPYCLRVHGQTYHRSGTLYPPCGTSER